ncbi:MAG: LON peptidase substrate-binding domain-containing protein, partial [Deltaproteobacteria bacterium]|nr:LON peptidase substrate-binding domain-containing protein [Deltaproteobacteria bacterium]
MQNEQKDGHSILPRDIGILPLRNTVAYPYSVMPLVVGVRRSVKLVESAMSGDGIIGLVASKDGDIEEPKPGQTYEIGTLAKIERVVRESG